MPVTGEVRSLSLTAPKAALLVPAVLTFALIAVFFPLPGPAIRSTEPYRVELLLAIAALVAVFASGVPVRRLFELNGRLITLTAAAFAGFILWGASSLLWAASAGAVLHHALLWALYLVLFLIFYNTARLSNSISAITLTLESAAAVIGLLCVFDYLSISDFASSESSLRVRYVKYGEMLATLAPVLWALAIYARGRRKAVIATIPAVMGWITVMLSLSKGAFVAGIIGFAVFFVCGTAFSGKPFRRRFLIAAAVWILVSAGTQVYFSTVSSVPSTTDYITGSAGQTGPSVAIRAFTWNVAGRMAADHALFGVGADNFGIRFNEGRAAYRAKAAAVPPEEIAEDVILERAHNEPLQVLAELGAIGLVLFLLPFAIVFYAAGTAIFRRRFRMSPMFWAAVGGMLAFAASSMVSSFSFRAAQNGAVFFLIFVVAVNEIRKASKAVKASEPSRIAAFAGVAVILLMCVFCLSRVFAEYQVYRAERAETFAAAEALYRSALAADPGYAGAYMSFAQRAAFDGDRTLAAAYDYEAIKRGLGTSLTYSTMAKRRFDAGDIVGCEAAYREAIAIFPRSVYLRVVFADFLENNGKPADAATELAAAKLMNLRQANGWHAVLKSGTVAAYYESKTNAEMTPPAELVPFEAVKRYVDKIPAN